MLVIVTHVIASDEAKIARIQQILPSIWHSWITLTVLHSEQNLLPLSAHEWSLRKLEKEVFLQGDIAGCDTQEG